MRTRHIFLIFLTRKKMNNIKNIIDNTVNYANFSEEVTILAETKSGHNLSIYTIKNKNGVVFQTVPGVGNIKFTGFLGFVGGQRSRPIVFSGTAPGVVTSTPPTDFFPEPPDSPSDPNRPVDIDKKLPVTCEWDVQLEVRWLTCHGNKIVSVAVVSELL